MLLPIRVLIADDLRPTRKGLHAVLSLYPEAEVTGEAADGQEAVNLVEAGKPDVVLMDLNMPVMDGLQATRRIKSKWPWVRVVILTMWPERRHEAIAAGADAVLAKGCPPEMIREAIRGK